MKGVIESFSDAPGGAKEEWHEFVHHVAQGCQVIIQEKYLVGFSNGFFIENENKGNRKYFQFSQSFGLFGFFADFAYLIPLDNQRNPLEKTWKFSVGFQMKFNERPIMRFL